ncbi:PREDICTED: dynein heavy chain 5, axonemal-like, partial [Priapulus caudatus]|uniref:Dynein heavy chain 5, axonemal-like n=1 Tax=Priapulus caudatus TaxID=37621 RepID=A0ABM1EM61_PRICU
MSVLRQGQLSALRQAQLSAALLEENRAVRLSILPFLEPLMAPHVAMLDHSFSAGLTSITWTSLNVCNFIDKVKQSLQKLRLDAGRVNDMYEFRIRAGLDGIITHALLELPQDEACSVSELVARTQELCARGSQLLEVRSQAVKNAVKELISLLLPDQDNNPLPTSEPPTELGRYRSSDGGVRDPRPASTSSRLSASTRASAKQPSCTMDSLREAARDLYQHFSSRTLEAIACAVQTPLETIRKVFIATALQLYINESSESHVVFRADLVLAIPSIVLQPTLEDIQQALSRVCHLIVNVTKSVSVWESETYGAKVSTKSALKFFDDGQSGESESAGGAEEAATPSDAVTP